MSGTNTKLLVQPGAQMLAPGMAGEGIGGSFSCTVFQNLHSLNGDPNFSEDDLAAAFGVSAAGPVLQYTVQDQGSGEYEVGVTRIANASDFVADGNAGDFIRQLETRLDGQTIDPLDTPLYNWALLRTFVDSQSTVAGVRNAAARVSREYTPQATAGAVPLLADAARLAPDLLASRLRGVRAARGGERAARGVVSGIDGQAYASLAPGPEASRLFWASPFYQYGKFDAEADAGYSDLRENIGGLSLGYALALGDWSFGFAGHYIYSDIDGGREYEAKSHGYGATVGVGRGFDFGCFAPWVEASAGYSRFKLKQTRVTSAVLATRAGSSPDIDVFTAALTASNPFEFGLFRLTPKIGVDWAHAIMEGYTESGSVVTTRLHVSRDRYQSFRGIAGVGFGRVFGNCLEVEGRAAYRHEFLDRRAELSWRDAAGGIPTGFTSKGRDAGRSSGQFGAGFVWRPTERVVARVDYDFTLGKRYTAHRLAATVGMSF